MTVQIQFDQIGKPAGVMGQAREDLALGVDVTMSSGGGPFLGQLWTVVNKTVQMTPPATSPDVVVTPTAPVSLLSGITLRGTRLIRLTVDQGFGLGARPEDVAELTFYAGPTLNPTPNLLPRRRPAFLERLQHNVPDAVFPAGNPQGWAEEWERWFDYVESLAVSLAGFPAFAWARWSDAGPGSIVSQGNIATITHGAGPGQYDVTFTVAAPDGTYCVVSTNHTTGGMVVADLEAGAGFSLTRSNPAGVATDGDFTFVVYKT